MFFFVTHCSWAIGPGDSVVVLYVTFPDSRYEVGTGVFVDHDGLILTADHVIHESSLATPSTMVSGTIPTQVTPSSITVYSALLHAKFSVPVTSPGAIVGGNLSTSQWVDAAFVRVPLTPMQQAQIQPLDLSTVAPSQSEILTAWGPNCVDMTNPVCGAPESVTLSLSSNPTISRDYDVRASLKVGYSGGPLVNSSNNIVGIASWGNGIGAGATGGQILDATYLPSTYIAFYFLSLVQPSPWFSGTQGCTNNQALPYLTLIDMGELFPVSVTTPSTAQCTCCCQLLPRAPNALNSRVPTSCQLQASCSQQQIFPLARSIQLAAITGNVDSNTVSEYIQLRKAVAGVQSSQLTDEQKSKLYGSFGSASAALATKYAATSGAFASTPEDALIAFKKQSNITEDFTMYQTVSSVLTSQGEATRAGAATLLQGLLGDTSVQSKNAENVLRKQIFDNVPKNLPAQPTKTENAVPGAIFK